MKFLNLLTAGILAVYLNIQAFSLPATLVRPVQQQEEGQLATAAITSQNISRNWSGYATSSGTYTGVTGTWTIPQNSQNNTYGIDATWIGIGGVNTDDLIQAGTQTVVDGNGYTSYEAFVETLPDASRPVNLTVHGGDSITASVMRKSGNTWQILLEDNTTEDKKQMNIDYTSSFSSAEWIEEAPSGERDILPLDNFGNITFRNATAIEDGKKVTLSEANAQAMHMGTSTGQVLATASVVGNDGASFTVSRTNTTAVEPPISYRMHFRGFGRIPFVSHGF